jgi:hypothetical protein
MNRLIAAVTKKPPSQSRRGATDPPVWNRAPGKANQPTIRGIKVKAAKM